jgi:hypothetical protein
LLPLMKQSLPGNGAARDALLHRYSGLKQRMIAERFGGLDEGSVSRDRRVVRENIETERRSESGFKISPG